MLKKLFLFVVLVSLFSGCSLPGSAKEKHSDSRYLMGANFLIDVCDAPLESRVLSAALQAVWQRLEEISWRMNVMDKRSDVAKINDSLDGAVNIGADTYQLLLDAREISVATHGAFDVTVWPLIALWKKAQAEGRLPSSAEIETAQKALGLTQLEFLSDSRVLRKNPATQIDLGGIGIGYAVDEAVRILRSYGFRNFLIDGGGELFASGVNCEGAPWRVGVRNPAEPAQLLHVLRLSDRGVSTSGDYEKYFEISGKRFSHIINPVTGYPVTYTASATVVAATAQEADAWSTALCVLGGPKGLEVLENFKQLDACLLERRGDQMIFYYSPQYQKLLSEPKKFSAIMPLVFNRDHLVER